MGRYPDDANVMTGHSSKLTDGFYQEVLSIQSNRLDGVAQFVQSFIKFVNCEIDEAAFQSMREQGAIAVKSTSQTPADVAIMASELDQTQTQVLIDHILDQICAITGMPSTKGSEASTSDNVGAVIVRNGWNQTEARAQQIESMFKASEREFLRSVLHIYREMGDIDLKLSELDIQFPRRQYENLQSKVQVFATLMGLPINPEIPYVYDYDYRMPPREYNHQIGFKASGTLNHGYADSEQYGSPLTRDNAEQAVAKFHNVDGSRGAHWQYDKIVEMMRQYGVNDIDPAEMFVAMNMMYSDYSAVAKECNCNTAEFYVKMAKAFLHDPDAKNGKLQKYLYSIAEM